MWLTIQFLEYQQNILIIQIRGKDAFQRSYLYSAYEMHTPIFQITWNLRGENEVHDSLLGKALRQFYELLSLKPATTEPSPSVSLGDLPAQPSPAQPVSLLENYSHHCSWNSFLLDNICGHDYLIFLVKVQYFNSLLKSLRYNVYIINELCHLTLSLNDPRHELLNKSNHIDFNYCLFYYHQMILWSQKLKVNAVLQHKCL